MSTIRATFAGPLTGTAQNLMLGLAKMWIYITPWQAAAGVPANAASLNVTSITDNGVGLAGVNITAAMASSSYSAVTSAQNSGSNVSTTSNCGTRTTTQCQHTHVEAAALADPTNADIVCNGTLA